MSAINVIRQRDRVILVTDGAVWDVNAGIIQGFPAKQATLPSLPAVFATRGAPLATPVFAFLLGYRFRPDLVPDARWRAAVEDGRRFLARWGEQAKALGWTARDLFGLQTLPAKPHPSYSRLSRYDETGLIWLLQGRPVVALTEATAAIQSTGAITIYRRHNRPALGPVGDSLDDLTP
jgi:hypothetical protein